MIGPAHDTFTYYYYYYYYYYSMSSLLRRENALDNAISVQRSWQGSSLTRREQHREPGLQRLCATKERAQLLLLLLYYYYTHPWRIDGGRSRRPRASGVRTPAGPLVLNFPGSHPGYWRQGGRNTVIRCNCLQHITHSFNHNYKNSAELDGIKSCKPA